MPAHRLWRVPLTDQLPLFGRRTTGEVHHVLSGQSGLPRENQLSELHAERVCQGVERAGERGVAGECATRDAVPAAQLLRHAPRP